MGAMSQQHIEHFKHKLPKRQITKFGNCLGIPPGTEPGVTFLADEIFVVPIQPKVHRPTCGICKKDHTPRCIPDWVKDTTLRSDKYIFKAHTVEPNNDDTSSLAQKTTKISYVPPGRGENVMSVRISNLSEEVTKEELMDLIRPITEVGRVTVPQNRTTGTCKGFAFVNVYSVEDGQKIIDKINGLGLNHLILNAEWSKPRK